ncbi:MAG TPA: TetR/AcrR family transcriptional regulator [Acidimicrobiales bacterium]|nr:TetR/AcrR family transcriptional regulator [Acidimicrobiales bacterium]
MRTASDIQSSSRDLPGDDISVTVSPRQPLSRESVMAAAREILVEEGLDAVSLRKVAASLGVTAPALYLHVAHKRDLLQGIAEQEFDKLITSFEGVKVSDPMERARKLSHLYVQYACENPALFRAMFLFRPELAAEARDGQEPLACKPFNLIGECVREAAKAGAIKNIDPDLAALTLWTSVHGIATMLLAGPGFGPTSENGLADSVIDTVLAGLAA